MRPCIGQAPKGPNAMTATMETSCAWKTPVLFLTLQVIKQYICIFISTNSYYNVKIIFLD